MNAQFPNLPNYCHFFKAESFKTKILNEDDLLDLIRTRPGKKSKYTIQAEEAAKKVCAVIWSFVLRLMTKEEHLHVYIV